MHKWGYVRGPPSSFVCRKLWCWQLPPGSKRFFGGKIGPPLKTKSNVKWKNPESPINPPRSSASVSVMESGSAEGDGGALPAASAVPSPAQHQGLCTLSPMVSPSRPRTLTASSSCCDRPVQFWPRGEPGVHVCVCVYPCVRACAYVLVYWCVCMPKAAPPKARNAFKMWHLLGAVADCLSLYSWTCVCQGGCVGWWLWVWAPEPDRLESDICSQLTCTMTLGKWLTTHFLTFPSCEGTVL